MCELLNDLCAAVQMYVYICTHMYTCTYIHETFEKKKVKDQRAFFMFCSKFLWICQVPDT